MSDTEGFVSGLPCWIDTSVETSELRQGLIDFYGSLMGWTFDVGPENTGFYSMGNHDGKPVLGIGQQGGGAGHWVVYFSTDDIAASAALATVLGGQVFAGPMQVMDIGHLALVMDPAGAVHGLWQPLNFAGFGVIHEPNAPGWFDHYSEQPEAAATYYSGLLGHPVMAQEPGMRILHRGDQWFASISEGDCSVVPPHWTPIFVVASLAETRARAQQLGAEIVVEEMPVPGSALSVLRDPVVGAHFTVMAHGGGENPGQ